MGSTQFSLTLWVDEEMAAYMVESRNGRNNNKRKKLIAVHSRAIVKINWEKFNKRFRLTPGHRLHSFLLLLKYVRASKCQVSWLNGSGMSWNVFKGSVALESIGRWSRKYSFFEWMKFLSVYLRFFSKELIIIKSLNR